MPAFAAACSDDLPSRAQPLPPLREHIEDIGTIVRQLFLALSPDGRELKLSAEDLEALEGYDWPGNVRQLIKVLKRSLCLGLSIGKVLDEERRLGPLVEGVGDGGVDAPLWPMTAEFVVIRLHGGGREEMEKRTGRKWGQIVEPKPEGIRAAVEIVRDNASRGALTIVNINNHYDGCAPLTTERFLRLLRED
ncbi:MAG: hypothetical protein AMK73_05520 [Planctomycetes bacterium SM23_32]|nr:MAG: hypothetical protein AMK73_05520 [Planctomycetes bacterium SM23_32]